MIFKFFFFPVLLFSLLLSGCASAEPPQKSVNSDESQNSPVISFPFCDRLTNATGFSDCTAALDTVLQVYEAQQQKMVFESALDEILASNDPSRCDELTDDKSRQFCLGQFPSRSGQPEYKMTGTTDEEEDGAESISQ